LLTQHGLVARWFCIGQPLFDCGQRTPARSSPMTAMPAAHLERSRMPIPVSRTKPIDGANGLRSQTCANARELSMGDVLATSTIGAVFIHGFHRKLSQLGLGLLLQPPIRARHGVLIGFLGSKKIGNRCSRSGWAKGLPGRRASRASRLATNRQFAVARIGPCSCVASGIQRLRNGRFGAVTRRVMRPPHDGSAQATRSSRKVFASEATAAFHFAHR
jgi:hypothetical protein